ncbi:MAG TPA: STAS/SEC14 domain-containing protein [Gaiellaceae bacterium]|nr:STAS/SEC14 domain-containing protein [Gaiellaceae bacterium]
MNYSLEFGGNPEDLAITLSGVVDPRGIRAFVEDLVARPEYRAGMLILVDISELDTSSISVEEYETVSDVIAGRDHRFPARAIAIVAPSGRTYDDAMQHRAYVGGSKSGREVFRSRDDATAWLAEQRRPR